jgi:hypothetical protein
MFLSPIHESQMFFVTHPRRQTFFVTHPRSQMFFVTHPRSQMFFVTHPRTPDVFCHPSTKPDVFRHPSTKARCFSSPIHERRVPHISLVFGEMWDSTALTPKLFNPIDSLRVTSFTPTSREKRARCGAPTFASGGHSQGSSLRKTTFAAGKRPQDRRWGMTAYRAKWLTCSARRSSAVKRR